MCPLLVIPGLVPGIHLSAGVDTCNWMDPGDKHRDDNCGSVDVSVSI